MQRLEEILVLCLLKKKKKKKLEFFNYSAI